MNTLETGMDKWVDKVLRRLEPPSDVGLDGFAQE